MESGTHRFLLREPGTQHRRGTLDHYEVEERPAPLQANPATPLLGSGLLATETSGYLSPVRALEVGPPKGSINTQGELTMRKGPIPLDTPAGLQGIAPAR